MKKFIIYTVSFLPVLALAQEPFDNVEGVAKGFGGVIEILIPIVFALALLAFFWGLAKYIFSAGNEESKADGKKIMIGGIIALFVGASIWGIIEFIQIAFGLNLNGADGPVDGIPDDIFETIPFPEDVA